MSKFAPDVPASLIDAVNSIISEAKVEPAAPDAAAIARRKKLQALKDKQEDEKADKGETKHSGVRKIAGHSYGGAKQKDDPEQQDEELKGGQKKLDKNHNGKLDADDFKKLRAGKKDEACGCNEESDQVEEAAYSAKAARAGKDIGKPGKNFAMIAAKAGKRYGSAEKGKKVAGAILAKIRAKHEEVEIDERTLTPGETEKKEKYVKSMKKGAAGFKARYGDRAKSVMYATATKMAKEEVEVEVDVEDLNEGKMKDIYTSMMHHADKKGYKSHKDFTPKDYDEVGKEHGISGKDLATIAGHKTAHQVSKEQYEEKSPKKELPFTPDKPHAPIAKAGKYGYGPSAAKHLAKQGMKSVKEETVEEGTGGPIYTKPFVKLGDLLSRIKDIRNLKKATIVTPKDENEVVMKKESFEDEHGIGAPKKKIKKETMMGKAGCTSEEFDLVEASIDDYLKSIGQNPTNLDRNKKMVFAKTKAYKTWASQQEGLYDGGQKGTQDIDTHMSPGATARG